MTEKKYKFKDYTEQMIKDELTTRFGYTEEHIQEIAAKPASKNLRSVLWDYLKQELKTCQNSF